MKMKNLITEVNRMKEIMGITLIEESHLLTERVTALVKALAQAGEGLDNDAISKIFRKINKNIDISDAELTILRNFITDSSALDVDILDYFINRNRASNMNEVISQAFAGDLDNIENIDGLSDTINAAFGDGAPAVRRYMSANGFDVNDLDSFKAAVRSLRKNINADVANKLKIGEMTAEEVQAFLKTMGQTEYGKTKAGKIARRALQFFFGDGVPSADQIYRSWQSGDLAKVDGDNASQQYKNFKSKMEALEKAKGELSTWEYNKKVRLQREWDKFVGQSSGFDSLGPHAKTIVKILFTVSFSSGLGTAFGVDTQGDTPWENLTERLKAFYEGFLFLPLGLMDVLGLYTDVQELKADHYIKFPDYDDTEKMEELKGYVLIASNGEYGNGSGVFDDSKYTIEIVEPDRRELRVISNDPPYDILETFKLKDINDVIDDLK